MVSHNLLRLRLTVTKQIAFYQQDFHSIPEFEHAVNRRCQALLSKLEILDTITFTYLTVIRDDDGRRYLRLRPTVARALMT